MPIILGFALLLLLAAVLVPQLWIRRVFARHGAERPDLPGTGAELARHLLDRAGLADVKVELTGAVQEMARELGPGPRQVGPLRAVAREDAADP